jgi:hypothetical protein
MKSPIPFRTLIPLLVGIAVGTGLRLAVGWWGFLVIFPWIGAAISLGGLVARTRKGKRKDLGRRIGILLSMPVFLLFIGAWQRENLQLEEPEVHNRLGTPMLFKPRRAQGVEHIKDNPAAPPLKASCSHPGSSPPPPCCCTHRRDCTRRPAGSWNRTAQA